MLAGTLGRHGVGDEHLVVAYDDRGGAVAARLWWVLREIGHASVKVLDGGPLLVSGPFTFAAANLASGAVGGGCALCRCGASANKPFCDGAHKSIGFVDAGPVRLTASAGPVGSAAV